MTAHSARLITTGQPDQRWIEIDGQRIPWPAHGPITVSDVLSEGGSGTLLTFSIPIMGPVTFVQE